MVIFGFYVIVIVFALIALIKSIHAQSLFEVRFFPSGDDFIDTISQTSCLETTDIISAMIKAYKISTTDLKTTNDKKATNLTIAYNQFIISVIIFIASIILIMLIKSGFFCYLLSLICK